ncbi:MAG: hypothetical protein NTW84_06075 [Methanothrix sp.]|nr:hypothetical protein [Methanothrix sp.]
METEIIVGKKMEAGNRSLYPVIKVSILKTEQGRILGSWLNPVALLVFEPGGHYAISLEGEKMTSEQIIELAPSLKDVIEREQGIYRIKVT